MLDSLRPSTVPGLLDSAKNNSVPTNDASITESENSHLESKVNCAIKPLDCANENNTDASSPSKQRKHSPDKLNESALNSINSMEEIEPLVSYYLTIAFI